MSLKNLHDVLVETMKDIYHAEKQLLKALPKMAKAANSPELQTAFEEHLTETEGHVNRLEEAFGIMEMTPKAKPCHGMMGLIEEGKEVIEEAADGSPEAIDAALICAAQKVEHYEISAYGSVIAFAELLELEEVVNLLKQTLDEEEGADEKLSELAEGSINEAALHADDGDEDEAEESDDDDANSKNRDTANRRGVATTVGKSGKRR